MPVYELPPETEQNTVQAAEQIIRDFMRKPGFASSIVPQVTEVLPAIEEAGAGAAVVGGVFGESEISALLTGMADILVIALLGGIVIGIRILRYIEQVLLWFVGKIPLAGGGVASGLRTIFSVLDPLENAVARACAQAAIGVINSTVGTVYWLMHFFGLEPIPRASNNPNTASEIHTLQGEITKLNQQVRYLSHHMGSVQYVTTNKQQTVGVPQNLWDQIHDMQSTILSMQHVIVEIRSTQGLHARQIEQLSHDFSSLTHSIHSIRAVATGWQDVEEQVAVLQHQMITFSDVTQSSIEHQSQRISLLEPLALLITGGPSGMKVLRQLEDTPCMCPKFPNLPSYSPEWLATYEFLTHG